LHLQVLLDPPLGEEAIDPAEIDERPVLRDALHGPAEDLPLAEPRESGASCRLGLALEDAPAAHDEVPRGGVERRDLAREPLSEVAGEVLHPRELDVGDGKERAGAPDIEREASLVDGA